MVYLGSMNGLADSIAYELIELLRQILSALLAPTTRLNEINDYSRIKWFVGCTTGGLCVSDASARKLLPIVGHRTMKMMLYREFCGEAGDAELSI